MRYLVWNKEYDVKCPCCGVSLYTYKEDLYNDMRIFDMDNITLRVNAKFIRVEHGENRIKCINCGIERDHSKII